MSRLEYDPTLLKAVGGRLKQLRIDAGYSKGICQNRMY